jgi:predicted nucleic acid-binding protein
MILLDTNVISALMRPHVDPAVAAYLQTRPTDTLFTASLCEAEIEVTDRLQCFGDSAVS